MALADVVTKERKAPAEVVDTRGLLCPYPYIRARQALEALPRGSAVEILTDSAATAESSIPILAEQNGYAYMTTRDGDIWRIVVTKP